VKAAPKNTFTESAKVSLAPRRDAAAPGACARTDDRGVAASRLLKLLPFVGYPATLRDASHL